MHRATGSLPGRRAALSARWPAAVRALLLAGLCAGLLAGCLAADSLGDQPPTTVAVGSPPAWDNGVGALMQLKCGVCHRVPRPDSSPVFVPQTFDLNAHLTNPSGVPGAASAIVLARIGAGILRGPAAGVPQMPLAYATPLVEAEIQAARAERRSSYEKSRRTDLY